jgi:hypothetical protein
MMNPFIAASASQGHQALTTPTETSAFLGAFFWVLQKCRVTGIVHAMTTTRSGTSPAKRIEA